MRVIGYLQMRAVGDVVEGVGFGEQEQQVREWAGRHGHEVVRTVSDRCSAEAPGPGLVGAVQAVRAGEADALVVTSRRRLGTHPALGVTIVVADEPDPQAAAQPGLPEDTSPRRASLRTVAAAWVAIAVAALVTQSLAAAADNSLSWMEGKCISERYEVVPCDGRQMARVVRVNPPSGCISGVPYRRPDGTWLCLD